MQTTLPRETVLRALVLDTLFLPHLGIQRTSLATTKTLELESDLESEEGGGEANISLKSSS